mgnify:CR=1 FL=1
MTKLNKINKDNIIFYSKKYFCEKILFQWENFTEKLILRKLKINEKKNKIIDFCVYFWGDEFTSMLTYSLIPSLLQENNVPKLLKEKYLINLNLYIKSEWDSTKLDVYLKNANLRNYFNLTINKVPSSNINDKYFLTLCHYKASKKSFENGSIFSLLAPDLFFGDGSIYNIVKLVDEKNFGYTANPPRVLKNETLSFVANNLKNNNLSNLELLKFALKNLHSSNEINSFNPNNSLEKFNKNLIISTFSRKTCNFIRLNRSDISIFRIYHDFNLLDKHWPRKLFLEGRLKSISDPYIYFHVELTDENEKQFSYDLSENSNKNNLNLINLVNNSSSSTWKI